ncbi:hypothetical protein GCM10009592_26660 [Brachybacterium rhamnosum]|uniref:Uncharacterized protein n=1 Tax=Brachybacterium rhamnosum TaxID=173361 RepID=A0ABW4Q3D2_9MICO
MNRYIIEGILRDLAAGRTVLVVSPTARDVQQAHRAALLHLDPRANLGTLYPHTPGYAWNAANGTARLHDVTTEAIAFYRALHNADGVEADVIVVDGVRRMVDDTDPGGLATLTAGRDVVLID